MTIKYKNIDLLYSDLTEDLYNLYKKSSYLAIDTEAMGLIHGRDRLCFCLLYTSPSPRDRG